MASNDPRSLTKTVVALRPADHGSSAPTTAVIEVDTKGAAWAKFVLNVADVTGSSSPTIDCKVQQSAISGDVLSEITGHDSVAGVDVTSASFAQITATAGNNAVVSIAISVQRCLRYLKLVFTYGGTVTASPMAATCELSGFGDSTQFVPDAAKLII